MAIRHIEIRYKPVVENPEADPAIPEGQWQYLVVPPDKTFVSLGKSLANKPDGTPEDYIIQARSVSMSGLTSAWAEVTETVNGSTLAPPTPVSLQLEALADGVKVSWGMTDIPPTHVLYEVQRALDAAFTNQAIRVSANSALNVIDGHAASGVVYYYRVRARDLLGRLSDWAGPLSIAAKTVADGADVSTKVTPTPVLNAFFEAGDVNWTKEASWSIIDGTTRDPDIYGMGLSKWLAVKSVGTATAKMTNGGRLPVVAGQDVTARIYHRDILETANGTIAVGIQWLTASFTYFSETWGLETAPNASWTGTTLQAIAPEGAAFARLMVRVSNHTAGEWWVDNGTLVAAKADSGTVFNDIADENVLTVGEKPAIIAEYDAIAGEYAGIYAAGTTFGNITERDTYATRKGELDYHLSLQQSPAAWNSLADKTNLVVGTTGYPTGGGALRYRFLQYYNARMALLNKNADTAREQAVAATQIAGTKNSNFYSAVRPDASVNGYVGTYQLKVDDLWFSINTTSTCHLGAACPGTLKDDGTQSSPAVHRGKYWPHRWTGTAWESVKSEAKIIAPEIATGAITADKANINDVAAGSFTAAIIKTQNYAEDANGNPTAGAKLDRSGTALKVAPGGFQTGARAIMTLPGSGATNQGVLTLVDGKNIASAQIITGTPDILRLTFSNAFPSTDYLIIDTFRQYEQSTPANAHPFAGRCLIKDRQTTYVDLVVYGPRFGTTDGIYDPLLPGYPAPGTWLEWRFTVAVIQVW